MGSRKFDPSETQPPPAVIEKLSSQVSRPELSFNYLQDLRAFVTRRLGRGLGVVMEEEMDQSEAEEAGWYRLDWREGRLSREETTSALETMVQLHTASLAYRISMKTSFSSRYPWLSQDFFSGNIVRELIAKHLHSYLHFLSAIPGSDPVVSKLRGIQADVFQLLFTLRRPAGQSRLVTVCHGSLWQGSLQFRASAEGPLQSSLLHLQSPAALSPVTDLANLVLTSARDLTARDWDRMVEEYYNLFNVHLNRFGLVLKHLGVNLSQFRAEAERALAGQFLVVFLCVPILAMFGPGQVSKVKSERGNTVRHLIQMMAISEEEEEETDSPNLLMRDAQLSDFVRNLLSIEKNLKILDTIASHCPSRAGSWRLTRETTAKYKPTYTTPVNRQLWIEKYEKATL